jgi:hypothetical protein
MLVPDGALSRPNLDAPKHSPCSRLVCALLQRCRSGSCEWASPIWFVDPLKGDAERGIVSPCVTISLRPSGLQTIRTLRCSPSPGLHSRNRDRSRASCVQQGDKWRASPPCSLTVSVTALSPPSDWFPAERFPTLPRRRVARGSPRPRVSSRQRRAPAWPGRRRGDEGSSGGVQPPEPSAPAEARAHSAPRRRRLRTVPIARAGPGSVSRPSGRAASPAAAPMGAARAQPAAAHPRAPPSRRERGRELRRVAEVPAEGRGGRRPRSLRLHPVPIAELKGVPTATTPRPRSRGEVAPTIPGPVAQAAEEQ